MVKVRIDATKCLKEKERVCVEICPMSVFREEKTGEVDVVNVERCTMCRSCTVNCPGQAIELVC